MYRASLHVGNLLSMLIPTLENTQNNQRKIKSHQPWTVFGPLCEFFRLISACDNSFIKYEIQF